MKARRILLGIALLGLAGGIVGTRIGIIPSLPIPYIIFGCLSIVLIADGLRHRNFFLILMPLAFLISQASKLWGFFPSIGTFEALGVSALTAAGLTAIFGGRKKAIGQNYNRGYINDWSPNQNAHENRNQQSTELDQNRFTQHPGFTNNSEPMPDSFGSIPDDGDDVVIDNGFGKLTRYLHSSNLKRVKISNGFGNCVVYYDNIYMDANGSRLEISNGFGQVNVYIPPFYRFRMKQDNGFGSINIQGAPSMDPNAPLIDADIDNGMGKVNIYFG